MCNKTMVRYIGILVLPIFSLPWTGTRLPHIGSNLLPEFIVNSQSSLLKCLATSSQLCTSECHTLSSRVWWCQVPQVQVAKGGVLLTAFQIQYVSIIPRSREFSHCITAGGTCWGKSGSGASTVIARILWNVTFPCSKFHLPPSKTSERHSVHHQFTRTRAPGHKNTQLYRRGKPNEKPICFVL